MVFFSIGDNSTSFFYLETIISSHGVLLVIPMKESEPISDKTLSFKVQMECFFIAEFERAAKIRKTAVYRFLISLLVQEL